MYSCVSSIRKRGSTSGGAGGALSTTHDVSKYNFISITRAYNVIKAAMAVIAFHVNKILTIYYFTNVSRQDFLSRVFRNAITPLVLVLIGLIALFPYVPYFIH
jgi:hypothetical protein